jgi:CheY-like chemotaxis protein
MATVLVVDENTVERRVVRMTLDGEGHRVAEAADAIQGLGFLKQFAFDVVLVAMDMQRLDGYSMIAQARALEGREATRFIALLEQHDEKGPVESFMAGASDLLVRPFGAPELRGAIDRATTPEEIDVRDRLVGIQLEAYETGVRLQEEARG